MNFSPESLQAFAEAAVQGSFSAAARKLGKSQSTVSEAIANLEIDLGVTLFDRSARQPVLTEAGRALLGRVDEVLAAHDRLGRAAGQLAGGMEPRLTVVVSDTYQSVQYEATLTELDQCYPELEFECLVAEHGDVLALIQQGRAQLGLMAAQPAYPPDIGAATVAERAQIGLYAACHHPLAALAAPSAEDLAGHRALRLNTYLDDVTPSGAGRCWSAPSYLLLMEMAVFGFGWAELPRWLVERFAVGRLVELPVAGWPKSLPVDVVWSRGHRLGPAGSWLQQRLLQR
ncbi:LysR family transcriptional regulator [Crenobacter sp. SG2305]|uniref:LysR family transcriptional regulator n=1 Tax=Crenobacter oryzisoli TaxID=3056844 RepID=UPI0025AA7BBA|nr:LysR family transcriptional regulator [Crenobacter sp. SG2305]MDN0084065.1 LysR family transcriptional regulator [Crenobacter sp. SG2305]